MSPNKKRKSKKKRKHRGPKGKLGKVLFEGKDVVVVESKDDEKMSEILVEFVGPYLDMVDSDETYRMLLTLAIAAWNISLLPEGEQKNMLNEILDEAIPGASKWQKAGLRSLLKSLIARKKAFFSDCKRMILSFDLEDTGEGYRLMVLSTLDKISS